MSCSKYCNCERCMNDESENNSSPSRTIRLVIIVLALVIVGLAIGMIGYHHLAHMDWVDSFLNASMILGGMGPVEPIQPRQGKIFAGIYALFSGLIFVVIIAFVLNEIL